MIATIDAARFEQRLVETMRLLMALADLAPSLADPANIEARRNCASGLQFMEWFLATERETLEQTLASAPSTENGGDA